MLREYRHVRRPSGMPDAKSRLHPDRATAFERQCRPVSNRGGSDRVLRCLFPTRCGNIGRNPGAHFRPRRGRL